MKAQLIIALSSDSNWKRVHISLVKNLVYISCPRGGIPVVHPWCQLTDYLRPYTAFWTDDCWQFRDRQLEHCHEETTQVAWEQVLHSWIRMNLVSQKLYTPTDEGEFCIFKLVVLAWCINLMKLIIICIFFQVIWGQSQRNYHLPFFSVVCCISY